MTHVPIVTHSRRHLVHAQVSNAERCRANEQQKQQKQQKQKQPKQTGCGETRVSSLSPDPAGAASANGVEVRICDLSTHFPAAAVCLLSAHASMLCA